MDADHVRDLVTSIYLTTAHQPKPGLPPTARSPEVPTEEHHRANARLAEREPENQHPLRQASQKFCHGHAGLHAMLPTAALPVTIPQSTLSRCIRATYSGASRISRQPTVKQLNNGRVLDTLCSKKVTETSSRMYQNLYSQDLPPENKARNFLWRWKFPHKQEVIDF